MHRRQLDSPLGHHVSGHWRVNATRDQQRSPAAGTHRHPAGTGQLRRMDIGAEVPDLHRHLYLRLMDVHFQMGGTASAGLPPTSAQMAGDVRGNVLSLRLASTLKVRAFRSSSAR